MQRYFLFFYLVSLFCMTSLSAKETTEATSIILPISQGYYHFDDMISKSSCGGTPAYKLTGHPQYATGLSGQALHFPLQPTNVRHATCGVLLPFSGEFFFKPFTLSFWVFLDEAWERRTFSDFFSLGAEKGPGFRLTLYYGGLRLVTGDGKDSTFVGPSEMLTSLPRKHWTHLALVYDGETATFYRNGELLTQDTIHLTEGPGQLTLGSLQNGFAYPMQGSMDEIRIYDKALTHGQVTELYLLEVH